jgi:hypothetical protein
LDTLLDCQEGSYKQQPWDGPVTTDSKDEARVFIATKTVFVVFEVNPGNTLAHLSPKTATTTKTIDIAETNSSGMNNRIH